MQFAVHLCPLSCSFALVVVQLGDRGVKNLHAIKTVSMNSEVCARLVCTPAFSYCDVVVRLCAAQLMYDFQFYQMNLAVDVPVLIVSTGKSLTPTDITLPLADEAVAALLAVAPGVRSTQTHLHVLAFFWNKLFWNK